MGFFSRLSSSRHRRKLGKLVEELRVMTVGELMQEAFITTRPDRPVIQAATKMIAEDVSCLVVMDEGKLMGIISERDYLTKVPLGKKAFAMRVKDIMTPDVVTVKPDTALPEAVAIMKKRNFRRLVIADDTGARGLVTQSDFAKLLLRFKTFPAVQELSAQAIMSKNVLTASAKTSFPKARDKMKRRNVGCIVITDRDGPVGIFTEYDVLMQFFDKEGRLDVKDIAAFMRKYVRAAPPELSLFEANKLLLDKRMRRLPIVKDGKMTGIVTQTDIVRFAFTSLDVVLAAAAKDVPFGKLRKEFTGQFVADQIKLYA